jgi:hypothetical protein
MTLRHAAAAAMIIAIVIGIAAWSKLRHHDQEVYDTPQRVRADEHPAFQSGKPAADRADPR